MYSILESTRNQALSDNWERHYLASCWEGPSSILPNLTACRVCTKSVLNILTGGYKWEMKTASLQVLGHGYWGTEAVLCPVHAISTKLTTIGGGQGKMLAHWLLLRRCPSLIPSRVFSRSLPLSLLIIDERYPTASTISVFASRFEVPLACAVKIFLLFLASYSFTLPKNYCLGISYSHSITEANSNFNS